MRLTLQSAPASEPVTTAEAKTHCRVIGTADDSYIDSLISAARLYVERRTGRALVTQTWDGFLDAFPDDMDVIELPRFPLVSVTHVKYHDANGAQQTWGSSNYIVDAAAWPGVIALAPNVEWPITQDGRRNAVEIRFVAGQAVGSVPADLKHLVKFLVSHFYENREPADALNFNELPYTVEAMLQALKPQGLK